MNDLKEGFDLNAVVGLAGMVSARLLSPLRQDFVCTVKLGDVDHDR